MRRGLVIRSNANVQARVNERARFDMRARASSTAHARGLAAALGLACALCTGPRVLAVDADETVARAPPASTATDGSTGCAAAVTETDIAPTAAPLALAAFGQTRSASELFVAMYAPSPTLHWPGNLKKYRLRGSDAAVVDADGLPALDSATGALRDTARSYWSATADGANVASGGAAALVPAAPQRKVFTHLAGPALTAAGNRVETANALLNDALLGTGGAGGAGGADAPTRDAVIGFIGGLDTPDRDGDADTGEPRSEMGDALHSAPAVVRYGARDGLVFVATNDGFLHAVDLETGVERWAFVPPEFLDDQVGLYVNAPAAVKHHGIGGRLRTAVVGDRDGVVEPGERAYLYFGMRRGGHFYYGLDVTHADEPQVLFRLDASTLRSVGQTWSTPQLTRIRVQGAAQNAAHLVLVIGGGYEPDQDAASASTDTTGNALFIVDAVSGALLWHGSRDGLHADFATPGRAMDYSLPADVTVVDFDGDGYADRLYAGDMGGQIWRFDVTNGAPARDLVAGGVIAQFGAAPSGATALADARRFYAAPDVAIVRTREHAYVHVGIGSGHRARPLDTATHDRFYALRDYRLGPMTQADFAARTPVTDAQMTPITARDTHVPADAPGWRLDLGDGGWRGEKVLAQARTFADEVWFTTYRPGSADGAAGADGGCESPRGTQRIYRVSVFDGSPVANLDGSAGDDVLTSVDRYVEREGGILPEPQLLFTDELELDGRDDDGRDDAGDGRDDKRNGDDLPDEPSNAQDDRDDDTAAPDDRAADDRAADDRAADGCGAGGCGAVVCAGTFCMPASFTNAPVRTYWRQEHVDE